MRYFPNRTYSTAYISEFSAVPLRHISGRVQTDDGLHESMISVMASPICDAIIKKLTVNLVDLFKYNFENLWE